MTELVVIWELETGNVQHKIGNSHGPYIWSVAFSPDARLVAFGNGGGSISTWDTFTETTQSTFSADQGAVYAVAFDPNARRLASGAEDKTVRIYDIKTNREIMVFDTKTLVNGVAFSRDGLHLAAAGSDETVRLWRSNMEISSKDLPHL